MSLTVFSDEHFMNEAYKQALIALEEGEIPVGAVIVCDNKIIAKAYNQTEKLNDATAHAEILAITAAFNYLGSKYLDDCTLYVTLEPCAMCGGASYWAQLKKLVYAAKDEKRGYNSHNKSIIHPKTEIITGIMKKESKAILEKFFSSIRK